MMMDHVFKPSLATQYVLEDLFNKNQTLTRLRREFQDPAIREHCEAHDIPFDFAIDLLVQMVLHKRATVATLVGILVRHFVADRDAIPEVHELQACADMLRRAAEVDLVDWDPNAKRFVIRIDVTADVYEDLERYQYPLPLVVPPREVTSNRETGYHSEDSRRGSIILKNKHHEDDVCLDHINRVNQTRFAVNPNTVAMVQNQWRHLDRQKEDETREEYHRRVKAFEKYDRVSREVIENLTMMGGEFYLTHRYDARGRCYAQGYHLNPQGNDWNKAVIEFADKEIVNGAETTPDPA